MNEKDDRNNEQNAFLPGYYLVFEGTMAIPLDAVHLKFGRSHDNNVVIDDPRVSRHHMEIRVIRDHFVIFDLNSSGGTYVNGQRVNQGILYAGDQISLAGVNFIFTNELKSPSGGTNPISPEGPGIRKTAVLNTSSLRKEKKSWWN